MNNTEKMELLNAQIQFRKNHVLDQKPSDPKLYNFSTQIEGKRRHQLTVDDIPGVPKNAERRILSTLQAKNVIFFDIT